MRNRIRGSLSSAGALLARFSGHCLNCTVEQLLIGLSLLVSLAFIVAFLWVAWARVGYPYDLEWMEGGMLTHSLRLLEGKPLFAPPSVEFIPYIYQPLYSIVVAALALFFGLTPTLARMVSIVSTLVVAGLLAKTVRRETGSTRVAFVATGLFFALFPVTGFWFDLARVDSFFLMLVFLTLYLARYCAQRTGMWVVVSFLATAAYFSKQTSVMFVPLAFPLFYASRRSSAVAFLFVTILLILGITLVADLFTDGWYTYYVHSIVSEQPYNWQRIHADFWVKAAKDLPILLPAALACLLLRGSGRSLADFSRETWLLATGAGLLSGVLSYSWQGGFDNNFIPFYVFAIIPASALLARAWRAPGSTVPLTAAVVLLAQFFILLYNPAQQVPTEEETAAGKAFIDLLARSSGPVLIPEHPWYAVLAGKPPSYQTMALVDLRHKQKDAWPEDLRARLRSGYYSDVVVCWDPRRPSLGSYPPELIDKYTRSQTLRFSERTMGSFVGTWARPAFVYQPSGSSKSPGGSQGRPSSTTR